MESASCVILTKKVSACSGGTHTIMVTMSTMSPHAMNVPSFTLIPVSKTAFVHPSMSVNVIVYVLVEIISFKKPMMILPI
eukprot:10096202-Karenia_brevis.AAC.1